MTSASVPPSPLEYADIEDFAAGARLLASGGGGDVIVGELLLSAMLAPGETGPGRVDLRRAADLPGDALVVHVGLLGSPDVLSERLITVRELRGAAVAVAERMQGTVDAVGIVEIGGLNALIGAVAAYELGVPLVDGDLMGRAFPRISQTTLALTGHRMEPVALISPAGDTAIYDHCTPRVLERLVLGGAAAMGGLVCSAMYSLKAAELAEHGIAGSVSTSRDLGRRFRDAAEGHELGHEAIAAALGGDLIAEARVDDVRQPYGTVNGSATLDGTRGGEIIRLDFREEFILVAVDGDIEAAAPDVIVALDHVTHQPVRSDELRVGQTLVLILLPSLHPWSPEQLKLVGPAAYGIVLEDY